MSKIGCIVLAAGLGTRMRSGKPKVLHRAGGRSLLGHVLAAVTALGSEANVVVTGPDMPAVEAEARIWLPDARIAVQRQRLGTAHAVAAAQAACSGFDGTLVVLYGDVPLISPDSLRRLCGLVGPTLPLAVLGFDASDPHGYGRLITGGQDELVAIREELDASAEERGITLCNSGVIAVTSRVLWELLPQIGNDNAKQEHYLTDLVGLARSHGHRAAFALCPQEEVLGVNDRRQLADIEAGLQQRYRDRAMLGGATLVAPETVFLSYDTAIGEDVVIAPHVVIGPGVSIGDGASIHSFSHLKQARVAEGASVGPYARLRPGTVLGEAARIGNFVEVKNAAVDAGAKINHLAYVGDAHVGAGANVGAGTITCNYDGFAKHHTEIGEGAFIGSNSALVAPVTVGPGAYVGSGSVLTRDVEPDALALSRARQENKPGWAARLRQSRRKRQSVKSAG